MGKIKGDSPIISSIIIERARQDAKWGEQNHDDLYWLGILSEEVGEVAKALIQFEKDKIRQELMEVAAVAVAWLECMERRNG